MRNKRSECLQLHKDILLRDVQAKCCGEWQVIRLKRIGGQAILPFLETPGTKAMVSKFIVSQARPHQIYQKPQLLNYNFKATNFACANRQIRLLSCMTCSLVPMQSSTYAAIVACSYSTNNAPHRYLYCKGRQLAKLQWQHFCIPVCGFLGIFPLN